MLLLLQVLVILLALIISQEYESIAQYVPPYTTMVSPVHKHTDVMTPLYSVQIDTLWEITRITHANFLIDIDAPFIWHDCIPQWNKHPFTCPMFRLCISPVSCEQSQCTKVRKSYSYKNPSCPPETNASRLPGSGSCSCPVNVMNPFTESCSQALLNYDNLIVSTTNGRNPFKAFVVSTLNAGCAPFSSFKLFPANVIGVMALSSSPYAFQTFFNQAAKRILALCLPSNSSAPGALFYGDGPYYFLPHSNVDVSRFLSYTPLLKHPDSFGYFIGVTNIVIKGRSIEIPINATTRLSTTKAYTSLRTDIYNRVIRRFSKVTKRIPLAKPVAPFSLCFRTLITNGTRVGLRVPDIGFSLQDGKKWTVSKANSIKQVTKHVACLAFVDGGATSDEDAIVIGTFQFEDNLVVFDLESLKFGFSSSLLSRQTSCANFNFTNINTNIQ